MTKRILRYAVPIDDRPHEVPRGVPVLFGRSRAQGTPGLEHLIDAWFEVPTPDGWPNTEHTAGTQWVQIVGTGQPVRDGWRWLASMIDGALVWHLYEVRPALIEAPEQGQ